MNKKVVFYFLFLSIIWGSSFILMKWGMYATHTTPILSPFQVGALRMLWAGLVLLPFLRKALKKIPRQAIPIIILTGWIGNFFPAFLFCIAETKIDSGLSGCLNASTPLFVILTGVLFFSQKINVQKIIGVVLGWIGCFVLSYTVFKISVQSFPYVLLIVMATFLYGLNANIFYKKLSSIAPFYVVVLAYTGLILPSLVVLYATDFFSIQPDASTFIAVSSSFILGVLGTALAGIIFYKFIHLSGSLVASSVTYIIPFVALIWGLLYGEKISIFHLLGLVIILGGVFLIYAKKNIFSAKTSSNKKSINL